MPDNTTNTKGKLAWQQENEARTKQLTDKLETGMSDLFSSDKYKEYLKSMSHFHNYSSRNVMLIHLQMPNATRVASYRLWNEKFNRQVKKGEKSLRIFAPIEIKPEKKLMEKLDPVRGAPMVDDNGKVIMEEMTALNSRSIAFKIVSVFDISQTYGEPLPQLVEDLVGNVAHYEAFLDSLKTISPLPIEFEPMDDNQDGYCQYGVKIGIREGMSEIQTVSAIIHEIAHARLHDRALATENDKPKSKKVKEIEAESVSYVVCEKFSIETGDNAFGYLATWGSHDLNELKASLDIIRKEANSLINVIDDHFKVICKERGIDLNPAEKVADVQAVTLEAEKSSYTTETTTESIAGVEFSVTEILPDVTEKEKTTIEQQNYQKLVELFPQVASGEYCYQQMKAGEDLMPLALEWINKNKLSITHTYIENGDVMYDHKVIMQIDKEAQTATTVEYQQTNPPLCQRIDEDGVGHSMDGNWNKRTITSLQEQINDFTAKWLDNISNQGYGPVHAILRDEGEYDISVYFNDDKKQFNLAFEYDIDGTSILNHFDRDESGKMAKVAHVDSYRNITFLEENLPKDVVMIIKNVKLTHEKTDEEKEFAKNNYTANDKQQQEQTEPMPDQTINPADRDAFGYFAEDILPLNTERAMELFNNDHAIFLLYPDNTEAMAFEAEEIEAHDGIYGIEHEDWQKSQEYRAMSNNTNQQPEAAIESDFINAKEDTFAIYQLMDDAEKTRAYRFEGLDYLEQRGLEVNRNNYVIVHTEPLTPETTLEGIFQKYNIDPPKDFSGHSLSVSDIIVFNKGSEITSHFVDNFGFSELPSFLGVEKQPEQTIPIMEQDYNKPPIEPPTTELPDIPKKEQPIYKHSADYALAQDEIKAFHASRELNEECGKAIDQAIIANNYELHRYDLKSAARAVIDEFGTDRVAWVVLSYVKDHEHDGRYSINNKAWAKTSETAEKPDYYFKTHPAILDGFLDSFWRVKKEKPSLMSAIAEGEKKSKAKFDGKLQPGLDAHDKSGNKKTNGMEV